jgi:hypothetical protein
MLQQVKELGTPLEPKRDPSRSVLAWSLRHRPSLDNADCVASRRKFEQGLLDKHGLAQVGLNPPSGEDCTV